MCKANISGKVSGQDAKDAQQNITSPSRRPTSPVRIGFTPNSTTATASRRLDLPQPIGADHGPVRPSVMIQDLFRVYKLLKSPSSNEFLENRNVRCPPDFGTVRIAGHCLLTGHVTPLSEIERERQPFIHKDIDVKT